MICTRDASHMRQTCRAYRIPISSPPIRRERDFSALRRDEKPSAWQRKERIILILVRERIEELYMALVFISLLRLCSSAAPRLLQSLQYANNHDRQMPHERLNTIVSSRLSYMNNNTAFFLFLHETSKRTSNGCWMRRQ